MRRDRGWALLPHRVSTAWAQRRARWAEARTRRHERRARDRAQLRLLPWRERPAAWWRTRSLGVTFAVYLAAYLVVATVLSAGSIELLTIWSGRYYEIEVTDTDGTVRRVSVDSGPYIYDPESASLLPAAELDLPGGKGYAVFIAADPEHAEGQEASSNVRSDGVMYATLDQVRTGEVRLLDWGLNYSERFSREDILGTDDEIDADDIAAYDAESRLFRAQSTEMFKMMTGSSLDDVFGANLVSNTAYYATPTRPAGFAPRALSLFTGVVPFVIYGGLAWLMFRRFYRLHVAAPLDELGASANRIAARDLDFSIGRVCGSELGRLSKTMEDMRASLLESQRELWRTAEERRRLNAAFAHDLRTPVTVLKGTLEMARMRAARGQDVGASTLDALSQQVERLERYASAMGGLTKLDERPVVRRPYTAADAEERIVDHAAAVVQARGEGLQLVVRVGLRDATRVADGPCAVRMAGAPNASCPARAQDPKGASDALGAPGAAGTSGAFAPAFGVAVASTPASASSVAEASAPTLASGAAVPVAVLSIDMPLVEEVLDNLLGNACCHARTRIELEVRAGSEMLAVCVQDDGPGFSPEALRRGCDPFFSESKSAEHFGLGLNVSQVLCGLHGGSLELGTAPAGGALVRARFDASNRA